MTLAEFNKIMGRVRYNSHNLGELGTFIRIEYVRNILLELAEVEAVKDTISTRCSLCGKVCIRGLKMADGVIAYCSTCGKREDEENKKKEKMLQLRRELTSLCWKVKDLEERISKLNAENSVGNN